MNIKKAILKVFSANFMQLISSLIIGFLVPAILSIEGYAKLKTYSLYIAYVGFFHLGFIDGLYIKYGGKNFDEIDKGNLKSEHAFLWIFEIVVSGILLLISIIVRDVIMLLFSISILPIMIATFHKSIYQATGKFDKYSRIMYTYSLTYLILNILLALILKNTNYVFYCLTTFTSNIMSVIFFEIRFLLYYKSEKININIKEFLKDIKVGFLILLGNLTVIALFGIDKWFVKLFLTVEDFAYYSFAVSMLNIINVLLNAISITFYNYLFSNNNVENINKLKKYLAILGSAASTGFFALSFIVTNFIPKYIPSLNIISITFAIFPYIILINALYVNLYKVNKDEKKYFRVVLGILTISILSNILALLIFKNTTAIASATVITLIIWMMYSTKDLDKVIVEKKLYCYMFLITVSFLITSHFLNYIIGGIIYFSIYIISTCVFYSDVYKDINIIKFKNISERKSTKG